MVGFRRGAANEKLFNIKSLCFSIHIEQKGYCTKSSEAIVLKKVKSWTFLVHELYPRGLTFPSYKIQPSDKF
jgi:hypothetical protein